MTHTQSQEAAQAWLDAHAQAIVARITARPVRTYTTWCQR